MSELGRNIIERIALAAGAIGASYLVTTHVLPALGIDAPTLKETYIWAKDFLGGNLQSSGQSIAYHALNFLSTGINTWLVSSALAKRPIVLEDILGSEEDSKFINWVKGIMRVGGILLLADKIVENYLPTIPDVTSTIKNYYDFFTNGNNLGEFLKSLTTGFIYGYSALMAFTKKLNPFKFITDYFSSKSKQILSAFIAGSLLVSYVTGSVIKQPELPSQNQPVATEVFIATPEITKIADCQINPNFREEVYQWCNLITKYSLQYRVDPNLIAAIIEVESKGNPTAYSSSGAVGLMQIMPRDGIAADFMCQNGPCFGDRPSIEELFDPEFNIKYGIKMIAELIERYGDLREALKKYGPRDVGYKYADMVLEIYNQMKTLDSLNSSSKITSTPIAGSQKKEIPSLNRVPDSDCTSPFQKVAPGICYTHIIEKMPPIAGQQRNIEIHAFSIDPNVEGVYFEHVVGKQITPEQALGNKYVFCFNGARYDIRTLELQGWNIANDHVISKENDPIYNSPVFLVFNNGYPALLVPPIYDSAYQQELSNIVMANQDSISIAVSGMYQLILDGKPHPWMLEKQKKWNERDLYAPRTIIATTYDERIIVATIDNANNRDRLSVLIQEAADLLLKNFNIRDAFVVSGGKQTQLAYRGLGYINGQAEGIYELPSVICIGTR